MSPRQQLSHIWALPWRYKAERTVWTLHRRLTCGRWAPLNHLQYFWQHFKTLVSALCRSTSGDVSIGFWMRVSVWIHIFSVLKLWGTPKRDPVPVKGEKWLLYILNTALENTVSGVPWCNNIRSIFFFYRERNTFIYFLLIVLWQIYADWICIFT